MDGIGTNRPRYCTKQDSGLITGGYQAMIHRITLSITLLLLSLSACPLGWAQDRIESGDLKGFTRSPTEHIINRLYDAFTVREGKGAAFISDGFKSPTVGMLLELRGPGESGSILSTATKSDGKFCLRHINPGKYLFKATMPGFQSAIGTIIVSPKAKAVQVITIERKMCKSFGANGRRLIN
jgi:hypothetical protein